MNLYLECIDEVSYKLLDDMVKKGDLKNYSELFNIIKETRKFLIEKKDYNVDDLIKSITEELVLKTSEVVDKDYAPGISTSIKLANSLEVDIYDGKTSLGSDAKNIDSTVRFDLASITKLFTAILILKESELGNLDLNKTIRLLNPEFKQDVKLIETLTFCHNFRTDGRIDECVSEIEALEKLKNAKVTESGIHLYSDIPYMIAKELIENKNEKFDRYFKEILGLNNTGYDIGNSVITGGLPNSKCVHDPKAKIIKNAGHAGIFSTGEDLMKLFDGLYNEKLISKKSINKLSTPIYEGDYIKDSDGNIKLFSSGNDDSYREDPMWITRGMMYKKHPRGLDITEVLNYQSTSAFASTGFTGTWLNFDVENGFASSILTNPLSGNGKIKGYVWALDSIKETSISTCIKLNIIKTVFEKYYEKTNGFDKKYQYKK